MPWLYGTHALLEALKTRQQIKKVLLVSTPNNPRLRAIAHLARRQRITVTSASKKDLDKLVPANHQGAIAWVDSPPTASFTALLEHLKTKDAATLLILDGIQDPQNLGAVIRSAACLDCSGVVLPSDRAAKITPTVHKTSAGAVEHIPVCEVANLNTALRELKQKGFWIYGADPAGENIAKIKFDRYAAVVIGSEGEGLHRLVKENCDFLGSIPQGAQGVSSLNASVAAGIILYEIKRQRNV